MGGFKKKVFRIHLFLLARTTRNTTLLQFPIHRVLKVLNSWKRLEISPPVFQTWKNSGKMVKSLQIYIKCFISEIFLHFVQILFNLAHTFAAHHGNKNNWTLKHHMTWRPPRTLEPKLPSVCEKNVFRFFRSSASRNPHSFLSWGCVLVRSFQWKILRAWYRVRFQSRVFCWWWVLQLPCLCVFFLVFL